MSHSVPAARASDMDSGNDIRHTQVRTLSQAAATQPHSSLAIWLTLIVASTPLRTRGFTSSGLRPSTTRRKLHRSDSEKLGVDQHFDS